MSNSQELPAGVPELMPQDIAPLILSGGTPVAIALSAYILGAQRAAEARWMPIETAPKDGSMFLAWVAWNDHHDDGEGGWRIESGGCVDFAEWCEFGDGGYVDCMAGPYSHDGWGPTHWMPLPTPPKEPA